jgi:ribulose 1,5-bisphosphate synthetase/thiazole synthase
VSTTASSAVERDVMEYDIAIVGGGPAGLACAIRLKQLQPDLTICLRGCYRPPGNVVFGRVHYPEI